MNTTRYTPTDADIELAVLYSIQLSMSYSDSLHAMIEVREHELGYGIEVHIDISVISRLHETWKKLR